MDLLRHAHQAEVFRILLIDLAGKLSVEHVSDRLSELADAVLDVTLETVWKQLPKRHRDVPRFAVIAYGKLGGKELGYASDLDVIFLYDDPDDAAADIYATLRAPPDHLAHDGDRRGHAVRRRLAVCGRTASRACSSPSLDSFRRYQMREGDAANTAWVWEHQALTPRALLRGRRRDRRDSSRRSANRC